MTSGSDIPNIRILPDDVANKIAAGEVVERPASVVKELVENALDARATRVIVRIVAAGRRLVEVQDNGHGMSEQNALLAVERHATSKIRTAQDLDGVKSLGFRGEALASIASVSRFSLITRRATDESGTLVRIDGGVLRTVEHAGAPVGTRVSVNRLYFNTPVRAKFLKGITTELGHCIDVVQRHVLSHEGVAFQFLHNDKMLLDVPEHATLRERAALIWGLGFAREMVEVGGGAAGFHIRGLVGNPGLSRAARSHQFFFINGRPVLNRSLQYGLEDGFRGLLTVGRYPVGVLLLETNPRFVDVNIHPTKREVRFRDDRVVRDALREVVRGALEKVLPRRQPDSQPPPWEPRRPAQPPVPERDGVAIASAFPPIEAPPAPERDFLSRLPEHEQAELTEAPPDTVPEGEEAAAASETGKGGAQADMDDLFAEPEGFSAEGLLPEGMYEPVLDLPDAPLQVFDTYLLVPGDKRLLIIDQHALHERLNYEELRRELLEQGYESQQLAVPMVIDVAPSQAALLEENLDLFSKLGIELETFGENTFQVTSLCHLYDQSQVNDLVFGLLHELSQGSLFDRDNLMADMLRLATRACKASIKAGDPLTAEERRALLAGFRRLRPPYTCPHGRPIIVELTRRQMEKSFRRIQ